MDYTTEQIIKKLKEDEGITISARTLNYYAYEKKMFPQLKKGKACYTDNELEAIKRIVFLKDKTSMSLDQIKECIENDATYQNTVNDVLIDTVERAPQTITFPKTYCSTSNAFTNNCSNSTNANNIAYSLSKTQTYGVPEATACGISTSGNEYAETSEMFVDNLSTSARSFAWKQQIIEEQIPQTRTIKINKDITITTSENVSKEKLIEIINFINSI